jgi:hypothetical protein
MAERLVLKAAAEGSPRANAPAVADRGAAAGPDDAAKIERMLSWMTSQPHTDRSALGQARGMYADAVRVALGEVYAA